MNTEMLNEIYLNRLAGGLEEVRQEGRIHAGQIEPGS